MFWIVDFSGCSALAVQGSPGLADVTLLDIVFMGPSLKCSALPCTAACVPTAWRNLLILESGDSRFCSLAWRKVVVLNRGV